MTEKLKKTEEEIKSLGIEPGRDDICRLMEFYELLIEKNKVMNLTAITDLDEVLVKHFADSLSLVKAFELKDGMTVIDVGTGAGFPGIPLAIFFPNVRITLMDSLAKRIGFLDEVKEKLSLANVTTVHERAEDLARDPKYRERYDLAVSRAVAKMSVLSEYLLPFVRVGGYMAAYKSVGTAEELAEAGKAIKVLGGGNTEAVSFSLHDMERTIVKVEKIRSTPPLYPRKAGTPSKKPIS